MSEKPLVTIIVAVYNQEKYIGRCIRSLLSQNFPKSLYDIIVINDGSFDNTSIVLDLFKKDLLIINNQNNCGLPASLNKGIHLVKTPYFVRVDADDYVSANFLFMLHYFVEANNYMDAVACDYHLVDNRGNIIERKNCLDDPIACGIIFRTDQIIDIGLYDEDFLLHEEQDLRIRFLAKHTIHRLELPLYRYRRHEKNITNNLEAMNSYMAKLKAKHSSL